MSLRPQWEWRLEGADGDRVEQPVSPVFGSQFDAEQWLGEHWRGLSAQGVGRATLLHKGTPKAPAVTLPGL